MLFFPSHLNFILIFLKLSGVAFSSNIELKMYTFNFNYDLFLEFQGTSYYKYHVEKLDRTGKIVYSM